MLPPGEWKLCVPDCGLGVAEPFFELPPPCDPEPWSSSTSGIDVSTASLLGVVSGASVVGAEVSGIVDSVVDGSVVSGSVEATLTVNSALDLGRLLGYDGVSRGALHRRDRDRAEDQRHRCAGGPHHRPATPSLTDTTLPRGERGVVVWIGAAEATQLLAQIGIVELTHPNAPPPRLLPRCEVERGPDVDMT